MTTGTSTDGDAGAGPGRVRLQRVLAAAGVASRRACEELIENGHVNVNGKVVRTLPAFVDPEHDRITVDGRPITRMVTRKIYVMLNKPARVVSTTSDDPEITRTTVLDLVEYPGKPRLVPVGRLDFQTMGLVLLTNDGAMVNRLTHPRYGVSKTYHAVVRGSLDDAGVAALEHALNRQQRKDDRQAGRVAPTRGARVELSIMTRAADRTGLAITLREGRTGNIAKMLTAAGCPVKSLERVAIGPLELTDVARGRWRELTRHEVRALKHAARGERTRDAGGGPAMRTRTGGAPVEGDAGPRRGMRRRGPRVDSRSGPRDGASFGPRVGPHGGARGAARGAGPRGAGPRGAGPRGAGPREDQSRGRRPRGAGPRGAGPRGAGPGGSGVRRGPRKDRRHGE